MLRADFTVPDRPELVDIGRLTLRAALDDPLARVVILVRLRPASTNSIWY